MRAAVNRLLLALGFASALGAGARAQPPPSPILQSQTLLQAGEANLRDSELRARENMASQAAVIQQNQLSALDAQIRGQQAIADVRAQSFSPTIPSPPPGVTPMIDLSQLASIPDDKLAASNERVRAASQNHR